MDFETTACIVAVILRRRKNERRRAAPRREEEVEEEEVVVPPQRRQPVQPTYSRRFMRGYVSKLYSDMRDDPAKFCDYYRMSRESFDELLEQVRPHITFQDTSFRDAISPEERLSVTLRYLATGKSMKSMASEYSMGATTIGDIVEHTCQNLWLCLQPIYMAEKTESDWLATAEKFLERTYFPNCIGAIDGKHVRIERPHNLGPEVSNYEKYHSLILLGIADADYCFSAVEVGAYGSKSVSSVFENSSFGTRLRDEQLSLPLPAKIPNYDEGNPLPFVLIGNDSFPLSRHLMRPYPNKTSSILQKIFNYRLSYARRTVECAFDILSNKWRILHRPLNVKLPLCEHIIKACCILHNYVRKNGGKVVAQDEEQASQLERDPPLRSRPTQQDMYIRASFSEYFTSPVGAVSWQYDNI